jgi:hypothetical protein
VLHPTVIDILIKGSVQVANMLRTLAGRGVRPIQSTLYRLDVKDGVLVFNENEKIQMISAKEGNVRNLDFKSIDCMIQRAQWHPNKKTSNWIASGGRLGIVRVEKTRRSV